MAVLQRDLQANRFSDECVQLTREPNGAIGAVAKERSARKALQRRTAFVAKRNLHSAGAGAREVDRKALSCHGDRLS